MFGVSPAYFFSRFSTDFTVDQIVQALPDLRCMDFEGIQLEIFHADRLREWESKSQLLAKALDSEGLIPTQFVAHFLLQAFESEEYLLSNYGLDEWKRVVDIVQNFPQCKVVTLPFPPFKAQKGEIYNPTRYNRLYGALLNKVAKMLEGVETQGLKMALEIMPFSLVGNLEGFIRLSAALGTNTLGYNFDTGHAYHSKEILSLIPARLKEPIGNIGVKDLTFNITSRIYGTHLKDIKEGVAQAVRPGAGQLNWEEVLSNLIASGYTGSLDLEIPCREDEVQEEYTKGLKFLKETRARIEPAGLKVG
ncbi:MAG: sugar phosphate isomerase/epimerase [Spirochaetales bacterium]